MVQSFPNVSNLIDALCDGGFAQLQPRKDSISPRDNLQNQLDRLDAELISLGYKYKI